MDLTLLPWYCDSYVDSVLAKVLINEMKYSKTIGLSIFHPQVAPVYVNDLVSRQERESGKIQYQKRNKKKVENIKKIRLAKKEMRNEKNKIKEPLQKTKKNANNREVKTRGRKKDKSTKSSQQGKKQEKKSNYQKKSPNRKFLKRENKKTKQSKHKERKIK